MLDKKDDEQKPAARRKAAEPARRAQRQAVTIRYIDRPDCVETFADSISGVRSMGRRCGIEFAVTRMDDMKPNTPITGRRIRSAAWCCSRSPGRSHQQVCSRSAPPSPRPAW